MEEGGAMFFVLSCFRMKRRELRLGTNVKSRLHAMNLTFNRSRLGNFFKSFRESVVFQKREECFLRNFFFSFEICTCTKRTEEPKCKYFQRIVMLSQTIFVECPRKNEWYHRGRREGQYCFGHVNVLWITVCTINSCVDVIDTVAITCWDSVRCNNLQVCNGEKQVEKSSCVRASINERFDRKG